MPASSATVVLVAHGSRVSDANDAHRRLAGELAARTGRRVVAAFLELAEPDIPAALDVAADGAAEVVVLPHFLLPGAHTQVDIPTLVGEACDRHPDVEFVVLPHLGADPAVVDVLAAQIGSAGA